MAGERGPEDEVNWNGILEPEERRRGVEPPSTLWRAYDLILSPQTPMAMRKVRDRRDIYPVFRELFERKANAASVGT